MFNRAGDEKSGVNAFFLLALALLPALVYVNSLPNSFQYDDKSYILDNTYVHDLSNIPHFFISSRLMSDIPLSGYRPLTMTSFALNYAAGGANPFGYHLTNALIHVLNTLLVFGAVLGFMRSFKAPHERHAAFAVAAIFACHPINTQAVNYISARSTLLVGGFSLLCILLYVWRYERKDAGRGNLFLLGSIVAYLAALLSKEEAVAVPGILAFFELCRLRPPFDRERLQNSMLSLVPFLMVTLAFLLCVVYGLGVVEDTPQARSIEVNLLTQAKSIFMYVGMMALPINLSIDHVVPLSTSLFEPAPLARVLALAMVLAGSISIIYSAPLVSSGVWWFILTLVPTSTLVALKLVVNEQRMYLAGVGLLMAAAAGVAELVHKWEEQGRADRRQYVVLVFGLIIIGFSGMTIHRNSHWRTPLSLWTETLRQYPDSFRANAILANIYLDEGKPSEALPLAERAVDVAPDVIEGRLALARALSRLGRQDEALDQARKAVDLNPASSEAQTLLGVVYARLDRYGEAEQAWKRAVELNPQNSEARENLKKMNTMGSGL